MKRKFSKLLSALLAFALIIGCFAMVPFGAFAESGNKTHTGFTGANDIDLKYGEDVPTYAITTYEGRNALNMTALTYDNQ